ncbi:putative nascent polypeptide-associated complex NAC domain, NAC A/B domain superfamily [Helianthus annuus]|nr:putative nascent polypeptide-associated complex NAC domain, NAC A/B domain superfamily [Helianthus annuus]
MFFSIVMNVEKLQKMAGAVRTGGKGSVRRKKKAVHKTTSTDDKRLQSTLKRLGVNQIAQIEEFNIYKDDKVIHFLNPKVQASIPANTWVVSGTPQIKNAAEIQQPDITQMLSQLGPENLKMLAEQYQKQAAEAGNPAMATIQEDDDDVPELVPGETFEAAAEEGPKPETAAEEGLKPEAAAAAEEGQKS